MDHRIVHSSEIRERIEQMWKDGLSIRKIASALHISSGAVAGIMHRNRELFERRNLTINTHYKTGFKRGGKWG